MKNLDRAEEILYHRHLKMLTWPDVGDAMNRATRIAFDLATKGLIHPDLPAPKQLEEGAYFWGAAQALRHVKQLPAVKLHTSNKDPEIYLDDDHIGGPAEAHALAAALLAAAETAEQEKRDD